MHTLLRLVVLAAVVGTAGIFSSAAAEASPPTVTVEPYELVEVIAPGEPLIFGTNPCPFAITLHHQGTFVTTTFFDADGTPIRLLGRSKAFTETYSANGKAISSRTPASVMSGIPEQGEHTQDILKEFGYSDTEIAHLRDRKIV